nr:MAG: hypothetical protein [Narnaviridae sp.]
MMYSPSPVHDGSHTMNKGKNQAVIAAAQKPALAVVAAAPKPASALTRAQKRAILSENDPRQREVLNRIATSTRAARAKHRLAAEIVNQGDEESRRLEADVERVADYITCPIEHRHQQPRFQSQFGSRETACATPLGITDAVFSTLDAEANMFAAKFRDPVRSLIHVDHNPTAQPYDYSSNVVPFKAQFPGGPFSAWTYFPVIPLRSTLDYSPHGPVLYPGMGPKSEGAYYWGELDSQFHVVNTSSTDTIQFRLSSYPFLGGAPAVAQVLTAAPGTTVQFTITNVFLGGAPGGYFALSYNVTSNIVAGILFGVELHILSSDPAVPTANRKVHCHLACQDFQDNSKAVGDLRHTAGSVMFTNTAALIGRNGSVAAKQVPRESQWFDYAEDSFSKISKLDKAYKSDTIDNGVYGYLKVVETSDLDFFFPSAMHQFGPDQLVDSALVSEPFFFPLENDAEYLVVGIRIPGIAGRGGYWTNVDGLEYVTNDRFRSTATPDVSSAIWTIAAREITDMPQWFENELHIAELFSKIKDATKSALSFLHVNAGKIGTVAGLLASILL